MWQGLGMTSPGTQRGKEDSWRCPDWRGTGLTVEQMYRGDQAQVQHKRAGLPKTLGEGELRAGHSSSPQMLVCSLAMVWTASHTQALDCPSSKPISPEVLHVSMVIASHFVWCFC